MATEQGLDIKDNQGRELHDGTALFPRHGTVRRAELRY